MFVYISESPTSSPASIGAESYCPSGGGRCYHSQLPAVLSLMIACEAQLGQSGAAKHECNIVDIELMIGIALTNT